MNINDVADFLDLVKNPDKYEKTLQGLRDEQARLNAVIETVGKASELEKLRRKVEKQQVALQAEYDAKVSKHESNVATALQDIADKRRVAREEQVAADTKLAEANERLEQARNLEASFVGREKQLKQAEDGIRITQQKVDLLIAEYSEKVAKLRSVMN